MADEGFTAEELVQACNKILVYAGLIARVANLEEVRVVCSSTGLFVAALEGFLQQRLEDVNRAASTPAEHANNLNLVVDVLSQILSTDLSHISGERIVEGSIEDISNLLELLAALCHGRPLLGPPQPDNDPGAEVAAAEEGEQAVGDGSHPPEPGQDARSSPAPALAEDESEDSDEDDAAGEEEEEEEQERSGGSDEEYRGPPPEQPDEETEEEIEDDEEDRLRASAHDGSGLNRGGVQRLAAGMWPPPAASGQPLSPIQEASREGGDSRLASQERSSAGGARPARLRGRSQHAGRPRYGSAGGASSVISIPSDVGDASRRSTRSTSSLPQGPERPRQRQAWPAGSVAPDTDSGRGRSPDSGSTATLLERALYEAEATLKELGQEYADFYYDDVEGRGRRQGAKSRQRTGARSRAASSSEGTSSKASSGAAAFKQARQVLQAGPWPDGETGTMQQHKAFLRRARRALAAETSTEGSDARSGSVTGRKAKGTAASGRGRKSGSGLVPAAGLAKPPRRQSSLAKGEKTAYATLLRAARGDAELYRPTKDGRMLLQRMTASSYSSELPMGPPGWKERAAEGLMGLRYQPVGRSTVGVGLNPDLESRLRYVSRLASENPKQRAAREAVQRLAVTEEVLRQARRRELVDRLSDARARREAALRFTAERLQEQGREYDKRVEQLRLQRLAEEWQAKQRSMQMRRALKAELALREAFLEVLEGEKEVLLAERQAAKAAAHFPQYKSAMRKVEHEYLAVLNTLEDLLAEETQHRVRATREASLAQRHENQLAAAVVRDRWQELLGRIAREEEAIMQRYSVASRPQSRQQLVGQIRRLLGLT